MANTVVLIHFSSSEAPQAQPQQNKHKLKKDNVQITAEYLCSSHFLEVKLLKQKESQRGMLDIFILQTEGTLQDKNPLKEYISIMYQPSRPFIYLSWDKDTVI